MPIRRHVRRRAHSAGMQGLKPDVTTTGIPLVFTGRVVCPEVEEDAQYVELKY